MIKYTIYIFIALILILEFPAIAKNKVYIFRNVNVKCEFNNKSFPSISIINCDTDITFQEQKLFISIDDLIKKNILDSKKLNISNKKIVITREKCSIIFTNPNYIKNFDILFRYENDNIDKTIIDEIILKSPKYQTKRGVKVGDSVNFLFEKYSEDYDSEDVTLNYDLFYGGNKTDENWTDAWGALNKYPDTSEKCKRYTYYTIRSYWEIKGIYFLVSNNIIKKIVLFFRTIS